MNWGTRRGGGVWTTYQLWVLALLVAINTSNYLDRAVLGILQQPIKLELSLTDWQLGVISGPAFAILYAMTGVPIARWAERGRRARILTLALTLWAAMTSACGLARSYVHLVLARIGVGVGESACTPVSHSLLSDYFPPRQRGTAMAILMTSIPIGSALGAFAGGVVAHRWGWRVAFAVVGLPGLVLAFLAWLTLREPGRGQLDGAAVVPPPLSFARDFRALMKTPGFGHVLAAGVLMGIGLYGSSLFIPSYYLRSYGLNLSQVGAIVGAGAGAAGLVGVLAGGYVADRFAGDHGRSYMIVPAFGTLANGVFLILAFIQPSWAAAFALITLAGISNNLKDGPIYAAVQNMVPTQMRATAAAINLICINALGGGIGPLITGAISDRVTARVFPSGLGAYDAVCRAHHPAAQSALGKACVGASATGLRAGLIIVCLFLLWAAFHLWRASRRLDLKLGRSDVVLEPSAFSEP